VAWTQRVSGSTWKHSSMECPRMRASAWELSACWWPCSTLKT